MFFLAEMGLDPYLQTTAQPGLSRKTQGHPRYILFIRNRDHTKSYNYVNSTRSFARLAPPLLPQAGSSLTGLSAQLQACTLTRTCFRRVEASFTPVELCPFSWCVAH